MLPIILRRLALSVPLLVIVSAITFLLESFVPGDPARTLLGINATPEQYDALRAAMHLDQPVVVQYWLYLQDAVRGDLGSSLFSGESVLGLIGQRLPVTLALVIGGTVLATVVGVVLGVFSATRGRVSRRVFDVVSLLGSAVPNFWIALLLVAVFAVKFAFFPATGYTPFAESPGSWANGLVLPVISLAIGGVAFISKVTRDAMLTTLGLDHIRTLRASGIGPASIIWKHALRGCGLPVVTTIGLMMITFIPGTILVENVFTLPGLGTTVVEATNQHDLPVVQGLALTFTAMVIVVNLLVDVLYSLLNPKVRTE
ncbi:MULTISPECIES: ABC transporter permease [Streptomyces]|uniref:ABC transporter permease n=1 Tax=Streptomyces griseiscabiei TaxID=2993540 RepID=A0ABU4L1R0_9ACTN|nr:MULTISPECIES: ABC transporter permease [Streptomyces]MBZ3906046.1 ABC transporter permease [Streptomyces griseiscabiei]MDX2909679.1 ABC transporter permease [Streptomyces griseiscabiei]